MQQNTGNRYFKTLNTENVYAFEKDLINTPNTTGHSPL